MTDKRVVWDEQKNKVNQTKHQIGFAEAATVFFDTLSLTIDDDEHSWYEFRFITIGRTGTQKLMAVFYSETDEEIRIISARKPTRTERLQYKDCNMKKEVDFSRGIRGKHAQMNLEIIGAVENLWAVCITHADKNLIPLKLYKVEIAAKSDKIRVKNEKGETVFCPKTWFAPLDISSKLIGLIEKTA